MCNQLKLLPPKGKHQPTKPVDKDMAKSDGVHDEFMQIRADVVQREISGKKGETQGKRTKCRERAPGGGSDYSS